MDIQMSVCFANSLSAIPQALELIAYLERRVEGILESSKSGQELQHNFERAIYPFEVALGNLRVDLVTPTGDPFDHAYDDSVVVYIGPNRRLH